MSIMIQGMEMPLFKTELIVFPSGIVQVYDSRENYLGKAQVIPLPEGHGRLGDLDALMNNIGDVPYKGSVRRVLMSAPTIVPAEGDDIK